METVSTEAQDVRITSGSHLSMPRNVPSDPTTGSALYRIRFMSESASPIVSPGAHVVTDLVIIAEASTCHTRSVELA